MYVYVYMHTHIHTRLTLCLSSADTPPARFISVTNGRATYVGKRAAGSVSDVP